MGSAFAKGLKKNLRGAVITVSDKNPEKLAELLRLGVKTTLNNTEGAQNSDILILAVKPQDFDRCLSKLRGAISKNCVVISIAAGIKVSKIARILRHKFVCRVMPNLLATIGESMSVWFAPGLNSRQKSLVLRALSAIGKEIEVKSEDDINKATAISGCGPAYVWYFMENLIKAGVGLGLTEVVSRDLTSRTFLGASKMGTEAGSGNGGNFKILRLAATSKGGMTEQAIKIFEKKKFPVVFEAAVKAAYNRAKELSK